MSVPAYENLGQSARDVFRTGFSFDFAKIKLCGTKDALGIVGDTSFDLKSFKAKYNILGKYNAEQYGKFSSKYSSEGPVVTEYSVNGLLTDSVDLVAGFSINQTDSFKSLKLCGKFHNNLLHATCSITKDLDRNVELLSTAVVKLKNFLVGYRAGFDTNSSKLTKNDLAVEVEHGEMTMHFRCIQIPREFGLSACYKVNNELDVGLDAKIAAGEEEKLWYAGAGFAYKLDDSTKLRMKFDRNCQLGTSLQMRAQDNVLVTLAFSLDLTRPQSGQHKVGLGLDVEA